VAATVISHHEFVYDVAKTPIELSMRMNRHLSMTLPLNYECFTTGLDTRRVKDIMLETECMYGWVIRIKSTYKM